MRHEQRARRSTEASDHSEASRWKRPGHPRIACDIRSSKQRLGPFFPFAGEREKEMCLVNERVSMFPSLLGGRIRSPVLTLSVHLRCHRTRNARNGRACGTLGGLWDEGAAEVNNIQEKNYYITTLWSDHHRHHHHHHDPSSCCSVD